MTKIESIKKLIIGIAALVLYTGTANGRSYDGAHYKAPVRPTKNLIVMLTDGTSVDILSAARWYQIYNRIGEDELYIDPYLCGLVKTYSSNAPIVDSAPAMSAYMTGMPQQSGNVSVYPPQDRINDLLAIDSTMAYRPLTTILEASKALRNKATGLVVTVEFPHATPAACSAHGPRRNDYASLASQMAYQNLDVMFGGGNALVSDDMKEHFRKNGTTYLCNDIRQFREHKEGKIWSLWGDMDLPYVLDTDTAQIPTLKEMTEKAIEVLSRHPEGFFLMVEGSKIDWAAHANDAAACITEYLDFDRAIKSAIDFAQEDGNTTVVILSDHGNSGFSLGRYDLKDYSRTGIDTLFRNLSSIRCSIRHLQKLLTEARPQDYSDIIEHHTGIVFSDREIKTLMESRNQDPENYMKTGDKDTFSGTLSRLLYQHTYIGFTTGGHTGEDVILAAYHPQGDIPKGLNTNIDINRYLCNVSGFEKTLPELTDELFSRHTDLFPSCHCRIYKPEKGFPTLEVRKGKNRLTIEANKSVYSFNGKLFDLGSVAVYIDQTETFYLPQHLTHLFNTKK